MSTANGDLRAVILDYGDVLCHHPDPRTIAKMAAASGLDPETFASRYHQERPPYDRGDLSPQEYWSKVLSGAARLDEGLLDTLRTCDVEMWSHINPEMADWLERVHAAGYKTALLSNMHSDMASYVRRNFEWLRRLDCPVLSCELRLVKPDRAIYDLCLRRLAVKPSEALFIDDREVNVWAAGEAGLKALRFESVEQLHRDLAALGFPVR